MAQRKTEPEFKELLKRVYGCSKDETHERADRSASRRKER
jgi:hypothetical protein